MSDEAPKTETPAAPAEPAKSSTAGSFGWGSLIGGGISAVGAIAGAGWPGLIMLGALGIATPFLWKFIVGMFNRWADTRDQERAGADAGNTAVDMANQGREVTGGLDGAQKADPPTKGFPEQK